MAVDAFYTCKYGFKQIVVGCKFQNGTVRQVKVDVRFQADRSREKLAVGNEYVPPPCEEQASMARLIASVYSESFPL